MVGLFDPVQLGSVALANRIVMAPLTRNRASEGRIPNDLMRTYYCQRATAGLILSEAASVSPRGVGYASTPGIWSSAQVEGWKKITQAVRGRGGKIFALLSHAGRVSDPEFLNGEIPVAPSAVACQGAVHLLCPPRPHVVPRALHIEEIPSIVADFTHGARNAREAGFDGVLVHAADGYLIDQFLRDGANTRCDAYGGSIENRTRLLLEVVDACIGIWSAGRVGVHLSPGGGSHRISDSNPRALFSELARALGKRELAFLSMCESGDPNSLTAAIKLLFGGPVILNEGGDAVSQDALRSGRADAVAFGKAYIANPDLVARLKTGASLNAWDASTFYTEGGRGYIDYPCLHSAATAEACA